MKVSLRRVGWALAAVGLLVLFAVFAFRWAPEFATTSARNRVLVWLPLSPWAIAFAAALRRTRQHARLPLPREGELPPDAAGRRLFRAGSWFLAFAHLFLLGAALLPIYEIQMFWHTPDLALVNFVTWPFAAWCLFWVTRVTRLRWSERGLALQQDVRGAFVPWDALESVRCWTGAGGCVTHMALHVRSPVFPSVRFGPVSVGQGEALADLLAHARRCDKLRRVAAPLRAGWRELLHPAGSGAGLATGLLLVLLVPPATCALLLLVRAFGEIDRLESWLSISDQYFDHPMQSTFLVGLVLAGALWLVLRQRVLLTAILRLTPGEDEIPVLWAEASGLLRRWRPGALRLDREAAVLRASGGRAAIPWDRIERVEEEWGRNLLTFLPALGLRPVVVQWDTETGTARYALVVLGSSLTRAAALTAHLRTTLAAADGAAKRLDIVALPLRPPRVWLAQLLVCALGAGAILAYCLGVEKALVLRSSAVAPRWVQPVPEGIDPLPEHGCWLLAQYVTVRPDRLKLVWCDYDGSVTWGPWTTRAFFIDEGRVLYRPVPSALWEVFPILRPPGGHVRELRLFDRRTGRSSLVHPVIAGDVCWFDSARNRALMHHRLAAGRLPGVATVHMFMWVDLVSGKTESWIDEIILPGYYLILDLSRDRFYVLTDADVLVATVRGETLYRIPFPWGPANQAFTLRHGRLYMAARYGLAVEDPATQTATVILHEDPIVRQKLVGGLEELGCLDWAGRRILTNLAASGVSVTNTLTEVDLERGTRRTIVSATASFPWRSARWNASGGRVALLSHHALDVVDASGESPIRRLFPPP